MPPRSPFVPGPPEPRRRCLGLLGALAMTPAGLLTPGETPARPLPPPRADSPRVGVDPLFVHTGLTDRWKNAMGRDLGWQAQWRPMDSADVLHQLESGDIDAGLFLSMPLADELDRQGLIHTRQTIGRTAVWLVGPPDDQAGIRSEPDVGRALGQVLLAAQAGAARWSPPPAASALAGLLQQLTQGKVPQLGSLRGTTHAPPSGPAYELLPQAMWRSQDHRKVWIKGDPRLVLQAQVACSFRSRHPGAKLLVSWLGWPMAQGALKQTPGWQGQAGGPPK